MDNRNKLREIIIRADITQGRAAEVISDVTKRPCSIRTVRAWLADPALSSSRDCPDWAIQVLETALK